MDSSSANLSDFGVATIQEAMGPEKLIAGPWLKTAAADRGTTLVGRAVTAFNAPGDNLAMHQALESSSTGDVLVVGGIGTLTSALWGELVSMTALERGVVAAVVDGAIRDIHQIDELGFPVWYRTLSPRTATKHGGGEAGVPLIVGGTVVNPGDIVVLDRDGAIAVDVDDVQFAIEECVAIEQDERRMKEAVREGKTVLSEKAWTGGG